MNNILALNLNYENSIKDSRELTCRQERKLIMAAQGDGIKAKKALQYLLKSYRSFIYSFVYRSPYTSNCDEDVLQSAIVGFIEAVLTFDYNRGTKFSTHAYNCITRETWDTRRLYLRCMNVTNRQFSDFNKVLRINNKYKDNNGCYPSTVELSKLSGIKLDNVQKILLGSNQLNSINEVISDNDIELSETFQDHNAVDPCDNAIKEEMYKEIHDKIEALEDTEKRVIKGRYGFNKTNEIQTCKDIAKELGVSRQRVSQIEKKTKEKLTYNI